MYFQNHIFYQMWENYWHKCHAKPMNLENFTYNH
jgi:hypothetical protein